MTGEIMDDPTARNLLQHLAHERDSDDPVGELARALLSGRHTPQDLVRNSWLAQGLVEAVDKATTELERMPEHQRAALDEAAIRLHEERS
ncbi:hypothetical protein AB0C07_11875 [Actinoplanes missouriensis]|uniref:hypothetical protein n=1 Tax=Actinoplanes missouriensis TaxID=1866 RepID=UPI0033E770DB